MFASKECSHVTCCSLDGSPGVMFWWEAMGSATLRPTSWQVALRYSCKVTQDMARARARAQGQFQENLSQTHWN